MGVKLEKVITQDYPPYTFAGKVLIKATVDAERCLVAVPHKLFDDMHEEHTALVELFEAHRTEIEETVGTAIGEGRYQILQQTPEKLYEVLLE